MIKKLESAGLGFYMRATETQQKLGINTHTHIAHITSRFNCTPGSRSYTDLVDTWTDSTCIHQLVFELHSKAAYVMYVDGSLWLVPINAQ